VQAPQSIVVLDFGSQYTQLIARRIREFNVFSVVLPCTAKLEEVMSYSPVGIILSGGPSSVYDADAPAMDERVLAVAAKPLLGVCYGLQVMTYKLGGKVRPASKREYGHAQVHVAENSKLFKDLPSDISVWMSHGDEAEQLPAGFKEVARSSNALAAMENAEQRMWAVQFHPEVHHTPMGKQILKNFVFDICGALPNWTPAQFILETIENIRKHVGEQGRAICALSGGVDSSVAATLVDRAMGNRLTCVFVDNGVLRKNEFAKVQQTLRDKLGLNLRAVDATDRFLSKLKGVTEPEKKRKIIGNEFIEVFDDEAHKIEREQGAVDWLVQGTLYPDVIESVSVRGPSQTIKSHHNVGGLPEDMEMELVEPLRLLFKDEVRRVGEELGLPERMVWRQPFPGPGLAIRIIGEVTRERLEILRQADAILQEEIRRAGLYRELWQSFAVLPAIRSVGVQGDERTYGYPIVVRAVTSDDAMTADWARLPYDLLETISSRIVNEVPEVNRVVLDITSKPPSTIEWE
jgi:GMP synthase (glutamine-hydrolysing)